MSNVILDGFYDRFGGRYPKFASFEIVSDETKDNMKRYIHEVTGGNYNDYDMSDLDSFYGDYSYESYSGGGADEENGRKDSASTIDNRLRELFSGTECGTGALTEKTGHYVIGRTSATKSFRSTRKKSYSGLSEFIDTGDSSGDDADKENHNNSDDRGDAADKTAGRDECCALEYTPATSKGLYPNVFKYPHAYPGGSDDDLSQFIVTGGNDLSEFINY